MSEDKDTEFPENPPETKIQEPSNITRLSASDVDSLLTDFGIPTEPDFVIKPEELSTLVAPMTDEESSIITEANFQADLRAHLEPGDSTYVQTLAPEDSQLLSESADPDDATYVKTLSAEDSVMLSTSADPNDATYVKTLSAEDSTLLSTSADPDDATYVKTLSAEDSMALSASAAPEDFASLKTVSNLDENTEDTEGSYEDDETFIVGKNAEDEFELDATTENPPKGDSDASDARVNYFLRNQDEVDDQTLLRRMRVDDLPIPELGVLETTSDDPPPLDFEPDHTEMPDASEVEELLQRFYVEEVGPAMASHEVLVKWDEATKEEKVVAEAPAKKMTNTELVVIGFGVSLCSLLVASFAVLTAWPETSWVVIGTGAVAVILSTIGFFNIERRAKIVLFIIPTMIGVALSTLWTVPSFRLALLKSPVADFTLDPALRVAIETESPEVATEACSELSNRTDAVNSLVAALSSNPVVVERCMKMIDESTRQRVSGVLANTWEKKFLNDEFRGVCQNLQRLNTSLTNTVTDPFVWLQFPCGSTIRIQETAFSIS